MVKGKWKKRSPGRATTIHCSPSLALNDLPFTIYQLQLGEVLPMKKLSFTFCGLALAFVFAAAVPAEAQTGTVAKGPDASVTRDPDAEKAAMKNLEAARHYFKLKKAYYASRERAEEILVAFPDFTLTDEVLYIAGMSGLYLSEGKGKQPVPKTLPPERAE